MDELDYYRGQSQLTDPGTKRDLFGGLPADIAGMAEVIDGVMVHRDETQWRFGFALPQGRRDEANTRHVAAILARLGSLEARRPEDRFAGTCRDFTVLLCAMLAMWSVTWPTSTGWRPSRGTAGPDPDPLRPVAAGR